MERRPISPSSGHFKFALEVCSVLGPWTLRGHVAQAGVVMLAAPEHSFVKVKYAAFTRVVSHLLRLLGEADLCQTRG